MSITDTGNQVEPLEAAAVDGIVPKTLAYPDSYEEVSRLLREANAAGQKVAARGGGTKTTIGNPIKGLDLVISTTRFNQLLEHVPGDLTMHVQAGANLAQIQAELEKHEQFLPVQSPLSSRATIGGAVAANSSGPARLQYGPARDWMIGVRFALADGTIAHAGGRVVKNVAGFDLMKLMAGSLGTLGIILDLNFKLLPLPQASATLVINFPNEQQASMAGLTIINRGLFPTSITTLSQEVAGGLELPAKPTLLVELRNTTKAVERQVRDISMLVRGMGGSGIQKLTERDQQKQLWEKVQDYPYRAELPAANSFSLKAGILPSHCPDFLRLARELAQKNEVQAAIYAHSGHGIFWFTGQYEDEEAAYRVISEFTQKVERNGGSVHAERLPVSLKHRLGDVWGNALTPGELKLMRGIKEKLDPNSTLNPGRYVAGI